MKHFVYLKIAEGQFEKSLRDIMLQAMQDAKNLLDGFLDYQVRRSAQSAENADIILVEMTFQNHQEMELFLKHSIHVEMLQKLRPYVLEKVVFDD